MPDAPLHFQSISEVSEQIRSREVSPVELTQAYLNRISELDGTLGSFITVMSDHALAQAREAENAIQSGGYKGPMHGIPIAIKDIIHTKGVLTSAGSKVLADHVADADSTIVERLGGS